jgi:hypothetical protein
MKEEQRRGKHCGRPVNGFDVERAVELRQAGLSWRKLASATDVPMHLLRTRLASVQNSSREKCDGKILDTHYSK